MDNDKVLLVKEIPEEFWGFPGGGVDHGETLEMCLLRELEEEIGVSAKDVITDYEVVHQTIGTVVDNIPRMNVFYRVNVPKQAIKQTDHVAEWQWFTREQFINGNLSPSFSDRSALAKVIFGN